MSLKIVEKGKSLVREVRAVQEVILGCFNRVISTGTERIYSIGKPCLNLCSRRWLKPTLSRLSRIRPLLFFIRKLVEVLVVKSSAEHA